MSENIMTMVAQKPNVCDVLDSQGFGNVRTRKFYKAEEV